MTIALAILVPFGIVATFTIIYLHVFPRKGRESSFQTSFGRPIGRTRIFAVFSVLNLLCVIGCCLPLGFAVVITTSPAEVVLLLQPLGQEFIQIVFGTISGLIAFALKLADQTDGIVLYCSLTMLALCVPYMFFQTAWYVLPPNPLELQHQWSWFKNTFQAQVMLADVRFGPNKPRAEETLEQYLVQMPEDVRALALGEEGAA